VPFSAVGGASENVVWLDHRVYEGWKGFAYLFETVLADGFGVDSDFKNDRIGLADEAPHLLFQIETIFAISNPIRARRKIASKNHWSFDKIAMSYYTDGVSFVV
jgi:hypothetical protein